MKHKNIYSAAIVVLLGSSSMAQDARPQADKPAPRTTQQPQTAAVVPAGFTAYKGSDVLGAKVRNAAGEVGKIEDLVIEPMGGRIEFVVLSMSGDRAKGNQWYAVPFGLFASPATQDGKANDRGQMKPDFNLNVDAARLQNAPGFPKDKWPDVNAPAWRSELDKHYGGTRSDDVMTSTDATTGRHAVRASELMGHDLHSKAHDEVGEIKELVIDARGARIPYVVISSGGFLGMGDKMHAIPWEAIRVQPDAGKDKAMLVVDLDKDRVLKAPEFKKDDWGRMSDRTWVSDLYTYYGYKPYWSSTVDAGFRDGQKPADGQKPIDEKDKRPKPDGKDPR